MKRYLIFLCIVTSVLSCKKQVIGDGSARIDRYNFVNESDVPIIMVADFNDEYNYLDGKLEINNGESEVLIHEWNTFHGSPAFPFRGHSSDEIITVYFDDQVYIVYKITDRSNPRNPFIEENYVKTEQKVMIEGIKKLKVTWTYTFTVADYEYALANGTPVEIE